VQTGTILALVAAPPIIRELGWPAVFYTFGSVGCVWLAAWQPLARDCEHPPAAGSLQRSGSTTNSSSWGPIGLTLQHYNRMRASRRFATEAMKFFLFEFCDECALLQHAAARG
jgi:hypothetical protein